MAPKFKNEVNIALRLIKLGNDIVTLISGRVMHPVSPTIGGFLHFPSQENLDEVKNRLDKSHDDILATNKLVASLKIPDFERPTQYMSIVKEDEFGTSYGRIKIGDKIFEQKDFHNFISEYHEPFSSANFAVKEGKSYAVGALARINNSGDKLCKETRDYMKKIPLKFPSYNPFHNLMAQALELMHYRGECLKVLDRLKIEKEENEPVKVRAGYGIAANEAPRGTLWHEYKVDDKGVIMYANIVTPTAQFLRNLNDNISAYVQHMLDRKAKKKEIVLEIEKLIRSYDPCFSCSSHFLKINWH